jgi:hypothetical protein
MSIEDAQSGVIDIGISALTGLPIGKARWQKKNLI